MIPRRHIRIAEHLPPDDRDGLIGHIFLYCDNT